MAAGDLITADHQYEFNGLLIGSGTKYLTKSWDGLFDGASNLRSNDLDRNDGDGVVPGQDLMGARIISCAEVHIFDDDSRSNVWGLVSTFQQAFARRSNTEIPFCFRHPITGGQIWTINCRPRKIALPKDDVLTMGRGVAAVQLVASKPEFYNRAVTNKDLSLLTTDASKASTFSVAGNYQTGPTITVQGALASGSTIVISGQTALDGLNYSGLTFTLNQNMAAGDTLVIDMKNKTVTINGTLNYAYKLNSSDWWKLLPGNNTVTVNRAGATGAAVTITLSYSEAWNI